MLDNIKIKLLEWITPKLGGISIAQELTKEIVNKSMLIGELRNEIGLKNAANVILEAKIGNPIEVVRRITNDKFKFYDYKDLDEPSQKGYYESAQTALRSEALQNTVKMLNSEFALWAAKESRDHNGVLAMRHQISGMNLIIEILEEIPDNKVKPVVVEEPHAVI